MPRLGLEEGTFYDQVFLFRNSGAPVIRYLPLYIPNIIKRPFGQIFCGHGTVPAFHFPGLLSLSFSIRSFTRVLILGLKGPRICIRSPQHRAQGILLHVNIFVTIVIPGPTERKRLFICSGKVKNVPITCMEKKNCNAFHNIIFHIVSFEALGSRSPIALKLEVPRALTSFVFVQIYDWKSSFV